MLSLSRRLNSGPSFFLFAAWLLIVASGTATRIAIAVGLAQDLGARRWPTVFAYGAIVDAAVSVLIVAPVALVVALSSGTLLRKSSVRVGALCAVGAGAIFGGAIEYFFFEEFDARFNHVAIDYLLFPGEVAGNIWQSYPVPLYVGASLGLGALVSLLLERRLRTLDFRSLPARGRFVRAGTVLATCCIAILLLRIVPMIGATDRRTEEIASNGLVKLAEAFATASLDYESYYRTVPALPTSSEGAQTDAVAKHAIRAFPAESTRKKPLDVVVILGESFGSEFVGRLHGRRPCAPGLERWAEKGLLLTNLVATGNRTVRGLEGVLCSFVPLPGDSIWKRDRSDNVATIARVLKSHGYRTEFLYGGDGMFDGMKSFAVRNGWDAFYEDSIVGDSSYPDDAFRTIWGVADETLYEKLLERQEIAAREGRPYFGTALTVSNHKPFLTPDSTVPGLRGDKLVLAGLYGAGLLALSLLGWRILAHRWGRGRMGLTLSVAWAVFATISWTEAQPRDSREAAVRYADRALADYLDRARARGLLDHTVVLFVGDHGARVYGSEEIPAASYRVPALFLTPDAEYAGTTIPKLCSQVDLAPTLLSLAGITYAAPFFGENLLAGDRNGPGRAFLIHNRNIGLLTDTTLTVLGLKKTTTFYLRTDRESDVFIRAVPNAQLLEAADRTAVVFQTASILYEGGGYRIEHAP